MAKPYSEDLRARIVAGDRDGSTLAQIAEQFGVSVSSVTRFRRLQRETGEVSAGKFGGHKKHALAPHEDLVREVVAAQPDITLAELRAVLAREKVKVASSSISRFLHHLNLTFKKKFSSGRTRPTGRRRAAASAGAATASAEAETPGFHRRNQRRNDDRPDLRVGEARGTAGL